MILLVIHLFINSLIDWTFAAFRLRICLTLMYKYKYIYIFSISLLFDMSLERHESRIGILKTLILSFLTIHLSVIEVHAV